MYLLTCSKTESWSSRGAIRGCFVFPGLRQARDGGNFSF
jgi:hypothetical protein